MGKLHLFFISWILLQVSFGQNLIENSSFENNNGFPTYPGQWALCKNWNNVNSNGFQWPYGSPDYVHVKGNGGVKIPFTTFANLYPNSGEATIGMVVWSNTIENYREYLSTELLKPLEKGGRYELSFFLTNGIQELRGGAGIKDFGVHFSTKKLFQEEHEVIPVLPDAELDTTYYDSTWNKITFEFFAKDNAKYMTLGNFRDDIHTTSDIYKNLAFRYAYYFIDDITLKQRVHIFNEFSDTICEGDELLLTGSGSDILEWKKDDPTGEVIATGKKILVSPTTSTTYYLLGFEDTTSRTIYVQRRKSLANTIIDTNLCNLEITLKGELDNATYKWNSGVTDQSIRVNEANNYQVEITDSSCVFNQQFLVRECTCRINLIYPNIITPNNDGYNEVFQPIDIDKRCFSSAFLSIYNRWGIKVYEGENMNFDWDGNGVNDGVYYYGLNCLFKNGDKKVIKGSLMVSR